MNFPILDNNGINKKVPGFDHRNETVVFQGILKEGRGLHSILKAMKIVKSGELRLIGHGDLEPELRRLVETDHIRSRIQFCGKVGWKNLLQETQKARAGLVLFESSSMNETKTAH